MFYLIKLPDGPSGYVNLSTANDWQAWIRKSLPDGLHKDVQERLISNLKHVLVGLEMKAALIVPHAKQGKLLFESYFHMLNFEFCVGMFSICEGLGSALWLRENGLNGSAADRISIVQWKPSLTKVFDPEGKSNLSADVDTVKTVRDKLHQDKLGARENIDWHAFSYDKAFTPAARAMRCLLGTNPSEVPKKTNLTAG
ncbi:hypothetical protein ACM43_18430 [Bradyrhizobium sp. CCBAU 45321]|uniref:hypothetical protein n=1 Tax=Bradyrhizobium sp. CCBAU 45321 TaxID=1641878 RepID=UPI002303E648|nr:hypothetical protein [Bradyrhizobium sp. CCBAU 45321]MDA9546374.1 hypothetical protein [Bradyrhizobium sp. CCBAU 45321]